jgi:hypothetical protein
MTTKEIVTALNKNPYVWTNYRADAKIWEKENIVRIYLGNQYVSISNGKATAQQSISRKGYYETSAAHLDRLDAEAKLIMPINVITRYVNYLLNK